MGQEGKTRYRSSGSQSRAGLVHRAMLAWFTEPCWPGSQSRAGLVHRAVLAWFTCWPGSHAGLVHRAMLAWFTEPGSQSHAGLVHKAVLAWFTCWPGSQSLVHKAMLAWFTCWTGSQSLVRRAWFTEPGSQSHAGLVHRAMLAWFTEPCWSCSQALVWARRKGLVHTVVQVVKHSVLINYPNIIGEGQWLGVLLVVCAYGLFRRT